MNEQILEIKKFIREIKRRNFRNKKIIREIKRTRQESKHIIILVILLEHRKREHHLLPSSSHKRLTHAALKDLTTMVKSTILRPPLSTGPMMVCRFTLSG